MPTQTSQMDGVVQAMFSSIGYKKNGQTPARSLEMAQKVAAFQTALERPSLSYNDFTINDLGAYIPFTFGTFFSFLGPRPTNF
jgi:hypothetical protein